MHLMLRPSAVLLAASLLAFTLPAHAAMVISATRLVVRQSEGRGAISVRNVDAAPALVQAWIDDGRADVPPEQIDTPFQVIPPLARIEADSTQALQVLIAIPAALPDDRESLYWFNVVEIPRRKASAEESVGAGPGTLNVRVRTRMKLIYRPAALKGAPADGIAQVRWERSPDGATLTVRNRSPWVVNLARLSLEESGDVPLGDGVLLPMAVRAYALPAPVSAGRQVSFEWIDDHGAPRTDKAALVSPGG